MIQTTRTSIPRRVRSGGFTLLELIVVITIIGILASLVVVKVSNVGPRARRTAAQADLQNILKVAEGINAETGRYPETIEDMINARDANDMPLSVSLDKYPKDPWSNEYLYEVYDGQPVVRSLGADNQEGGEGEDADLVLPEDAEAY